MQITDEFWSVENPSINPYYRRILGVTDGFLSSVISVFFVVGVEITLNLRNEMESVMQWDALKWRMESPRIEAREA